MNAVLLNCTLKPSPAESNTQALMDRVIATLERLGPLSLAAGSTRSPLRALPGFKGFQGGPQAVALLDQRVELLEALADLSL